MARRGARPALPLLGCRRSGDLEPQLFQTPCQFAVEHRRQQILQQFSAGHLAVTLVLGAGTWLEPVSYTHLTLPTKA